MGKDAKPKKLTPEQVDARLSKIEQAVEKRNAQHPDIAKRPPIAKEDAEYIAEILRDGDIFRNEGAFRDKGFNLRIRAAVIAKQDGYLNHKEVAMARRAFIDLLKGKTEAFDKLQQDKDNHHDVLVLIEEYRVALEKAKKDRRDPEKAVAEMLASLAVLPDDPVLKEALAHRHQLAPIDDLLPAPSGNSKPSIFDKS